MKKAFVVLVHKDPVLCNMLFEQILSDSDSDIYLHVDKKSEAMTVRLLSSERIFVSKNNIELHWGHDSILKSTLIMYREIINSGKKYDYVFLLSGQDLIVNDGLDRFLEENEGRAFISSDRKNIGEIDAYCRMMLLHKWPERYKRLYDFKFHPVKIMRSIHCRLSKQFPWYQKKDVNWNVDEITFYYDSAWVVLPLEIVKWIMDFLDENPGFFEIYDGALLAEEKFFSTVILNYSPYADRLVYKNDRSVSLTYVTPIINNHPQIITMKDIKDIESCNGMFFARKFDCSVDSGVCKFFYKKITKKSKDSIGF